LKDIKRVVVKVGTSTLTYNNGKLNIKRIEQLVRVLSDLKNGGKEIILVTSGAIGVGTSKLGLHERPEETRVKQAAAAVGQCELMSLYSKLFTEYGHFVGQILMTRIITDRDNTKRNLINTFDTLLSLGVIPIVNENDSVSVEEIECDDIAFGGNDKLSAIVAALINADILILLSDIEGLYTHDPRNCDDAMLIPVVNEITDELRAIAGGAGTEFGTGGMLSKLEAAEIANEAGFDMVIMDGSSPEKLYDLFEGKPIGTIFCAKKGRL
jgi:glutamate 5-kinase